MFYILTLVTSSGSSNGTAYQTRQDRRNRAFQKITDLVDHSWLFQWGGAQEATHALHTDFSDIKCII